MGTKTQYETKIPPMEKWHSGSPSEVISSSLPSCASHLYGPGTLVESCSYGDRTLKKEMRHYPRLDMYVRRSLNRLAINTYVRMDSSVLPMGNTHTGEWIELGRMNNVKYDDEETGLSVYYPDSPYSKELLPVGALGLVCSYVKVGRDTKKVPMGEFFLPSLKDPNFYIVFFIEYLDVVKAGHYLIPVKEVKKARERETYEQGLLIVP